MNGITGGESDLWLRPYRSVPRPRLRLICFPHAGGAASAYRSWPRHLPRDVEILAACYPGRERRLDEPAIGRMDRLVDSFVEVLRPLLDRPLALFGHSMGASVAHEVAIRLNDLPQAVLAGLFVSSRVPPHRLDVPVKIEDDDALIKEILRLGHGNAEVFDDPELRELILPAIRADYRVVATYPPGPRAPVPVPVTAYGGTVDPDVSLEDVRGWSAVTSELFDCRVFPGGHFYLERHETQLVQDIAHRLAAFSAVPVPRRAS